MICAVADTHAVIWYLRGDNRISRKAKKFIEQAASRGEQIGVSAITFIEMVYLVEKGRIDSLALKNLHDAIQAGDSVWVEIPLNSEIAYEMQKISRDSVPDMPDRIIAATAQAMDIPLLSRDGKIRVAGLETIW